MSYTIRQKNIGREKIISRMGTSNVNSHTKAYEGGALHGTIRNFSDGQTKIPKQIQQSKRNVMKR